MSTTIKTYVMDQVWDEELGANVYAERDPNATLKEALTGFASLRPASAKSHAEPAGDTLDRAARLLMAKTPAMTYAQAFHAVLAVDPALKTRYHRGE
jgi:hypothetical protein